jgi:Zn-dependent peptidase ImmA (M78 family)
MDASGLFNYKKTFGMVRPAVKQLLKNHNKVDFLKNPAIDVEEIAMESGITELKYVHKDEIGGEHAVLRGSIIYVDKDEVEGGQRFSIAHEVGHWVLEGRNGAKDEKQAARKGDSWKRKSLEQIIKLSPLDQINNRTIEDIFKSVNEGLMDYFAANLLMPVERFLLWENKSDQEIAAAFGVKPRAVEKRRAEANGELEMLTPDTACSNGPYSREVIPYANVKTLIEETFPVDAQ